MKNPPKKYDQATQTLQPAMTAPQYNYVVSDPSSLDTRVITPSDATFVLKSFRGEEAFSELFEFDVEMTLSVPGDPSATDYPIEDMLRGEASVGIQRDGEWRWWTGIITEFVQGDTVHMMYEDEEHSVTHFKMRLRPQLWLTTLRKNCRIFQNQTTFDIIADILQEQDIIVSDSTTGDTKMREYCVQYNESDFDFISRLMEDEGIFYFFDHGKQHTLVLCDEDSSFQSGQTGPIPYFVAPTMRAVSRHLEVRHNIVPSAHTTSDFSYLNPDMSLTAGDSGVDLDTYYTYPGGHEEQECGEEIVEKRQKSVDAQRVVWRAHVDNVHVRVGHGFSLTGVPRSDVNEVDCAVSRMEFEISTPMDDVDLTSATYGSVVTFFDGAVPFVPEEKTPKPRIYGVQTAIVTGGEDEEICVDEYGRVRVKFHWDLSDTEGEDTSCWIRVAQGWAGPTWGMLFTPRIGHEVVVAFVDGDPDYPLITGCVYNEAMRPPYLAEGRPTCSGWRTASSLDSDGEGQKKNELYFDDLSGAEEIFLHAQKDLNVVVHRGSRTALIEAAGDDDGNCALEMTRGSRTELLKEGNSETTLEKGDMVFLIKEGNKSKTIEKGDWVVELSQGNHTLTISQGDMTVSITGNQTTEITQDYTMDVTGNVAITVQGTTSIESTGAIDIKSTADVNIEGMNVNVKGQMNVAQEAGMNFSQEAGMNFSQEAGLMFEQAGVMVTVEATATMELKGLVNTVKADTMLTLEGSAMLKGTGGVIMLG